MQPAETSPVGPWDPNWRPDPTGQRLIAIRVARRAALASALIFGTLVVVAALVSHPFPAVAGAELFVGVVVALFSLPGLALLGAGLTSGALGSRASAASAGLAMAVGVPVAALTSTMIGVFLLVGIVPGAGDGMNAAGLVLRSGVTAAVRISPLIALASVAWVVLVRRLGRSVGGGLPDTPA